MPLTREQFRTKTFALKDGRCCVPGCKHQAVDPHHIMERALWLKDDPSPEGYLVENGAPLCEQHHKDAEQNLIPPQALRRWLGSRSLVLPAQLDGDKMWDKWGEEIPTLPNHKYPRTPYLSLHYGDEEKVPLELFVNVPLVVTVKMDGANVTIDEVRIAARNGETANHPSFSPLKARQAAIAQGLPKGVILFGEWMYARHSIAYEGPLALPDHLMAITAYDPKHQLVLSWEETENIAKSCDIPTVPVLARGRWREEWELSRDLYALFELAVKQGHEGIVVRSQYPFHTGRFGQYIAKMVRSDHNQCPPDWKRREIVKNQLIS